MQFIVTGNPNVAAYVEFLRFRVGSPMDMFSGFPRLVSRFTNLRTLRCGYDEKYAGWNMVRGPQKEWWKSIIRLPSLTSLQLRNFWGVPISVLLPYTNLGALCINDCSTFSEPELEGSPGNVSRLPLPNLISVHTAREFSSLDPLFNVYPSIGLPVVDKNKLQCLFLFKIRDKECSKLRDFPSLQAFGVDICEFVHY